MEPIASNPFAVGTSVGGTPYFVGRRDIIRNVVSVLQQPLAAGLVLFGQRRIGKSSILRELEEKLSEMGPWTPVFFDLQRHSQATLEEILEDLASTIAAALELPEPSFGPDIAHVFRKSWLASVLAGRKPDWRLVLLFDEFDILADPKARMSNVRLFEFLRSIFDDKDLRTQVAAVYAMGRTMGDLDISTGPLFRGIRSEAVSTLSRHDFDLLLARGVTSGGIEWGQGVSDAIWQLTAGHPMLTQLIASRAWTRAVSGERRVEMRHLEELTQGVLRESHHILHWLWEGLTPACRVVASAFAEHESRTLTGDQLGLLLRQSGVRIMMGQLDEAPRRLCDWDILHEETTTPRRYRFKVELLRTWVRQHRPFASVREFIDHLNPEADEDYSRALRDWNKSERTSDDIAQIIQRLGFVLDPVRGNPNHVGATELLAELYIAQGNFDKAIQVVERQLPQQTAALRPRYVQLLLSKAEELAGKEDDEAARQHCFEQILQVAPGTTEALMGLRDIWRVQGRRAHVAGRLVEARDLYVKAEQDVLVSEIEGELIRVQGEQAQQQIHELEKAEQFHEALVLFDQHGEALRGLLGSDADRMRQQLEHERRLHGHYTAGREAAAQGDRLRAFTNFGEILAVAPEYKQLQTELGRLLVKRRSWAQWLGWPLAGLFGGALLVALVLLRQAAEERPGASAGEAAATGPVPSPAPAPAPNNGVPGTSLAAAPASAAIVTPPSEVGVDSSSGAIDGVAPRDVSGGPPGAKDDAVSRRPRPSAASAAGGPRRGQSKPVRTSKSEGGAAPSVPVAPVAARRSMIDVAGEFAPLISKVCPAEYSTKSATITIEFAVDIATGKVLEVKMTKLNGSLEQPQCIAEHAEVIKKATTFAAAEPREERFSARYLVSP